MYAMCTSATGCAKNRHHIASSEIRNTNWDAGTGKSDT